MPDTLPPRVNVRLTTEERATLATIAAAVSVPHRRAPTITEAVRAALNIAAATLRADGAVKAS